MKYEALFTRAEHSGQDGTFLRIDETHPVDIFLGVERGHRVLMVKCCGRPPEPPAFATVRIEIRQQGSKNWLLILRLEQPELRALFNRLIEDLDAACRERPEAPCEIIIERLARWQKLLSRGTLELLSDHEIRGLAAELAFLLDEAIPAFAVDAAMAAWVGPKAAPKDFVLVDREIEVKAIHRQKHSVTISSLDQLSDAGLPIFLWTKVVELLSGPSPGAVTFSSLVGRARHVVLGSFGPQEQLEEALLLVGYEDRAEYNTKFLRLGDVHCYAVRPGFPRLQRTAESVHITMCKYEVSLAGLGGYLVESWR